MAEVQEHGQAANRDLEAHEEYEKKEDEPSSEDGSDYGSIYDHERQGWGGHEPHLDRVKSSQSARARRNSQSGIYRTGTNILATVRSRRPIGPFTHKLSTVPTTQDVIVDFDGPDDPYRPINWPFKKKVMTTALYGFTTMGSTFASAVYSTAIPAVSERFGISQEVSALGTSMMLLGYGLGPLLWAPLSEVYGRKQAVLGPYFISAIFSIATATAKDTQTVMLSRFFTGLFGSAPVTNTGGVLGDLYSAEQRGVAIVFYALAVVGGPCLGPIVGSAIITSYLGWRWTEYITAIMQFFFLTLDIIFVDETYPNKLLVYKARRLRHETGNWALHARHEEWDVSITELAKKYLVRPFQILFTPIAMLVAIYASFVYSILYANLSAFPIEFQEERGWSPVVASLPFLAILLGMFLGSGLNILNQKRYVKAFRANGNRAVPEARLPPMMAGSIIFSAGLFLFAWTSSKHVHWICPCIGGVLLGTGFLTIFQAALNYLIDTFQKYSASAVAANTFLRSVMAAGFPLFMTPLLHNVGIDWGISIFAFFSVLMIPIPYLFFVFGKRIRARGYWSKESV